jgi:hypothetical protein
VAICSRLCLYILSVASGPDVPQTRGMRSMSLGEALISTALLSIYVGARGTALAIEAAQTSPTLCANAAASVLERTSSLERMRDTWTLAVFSAI